MQISCCKAWHITVRYISMHEIDGTGNVVELQKLKVHQTAL